MCNHLIYPAVTVGLPDLLIPKEIPEEEGKGKKESAPRKRQTRGKYILGGAWPPLGPKVCFHLWLELGLGRLKVRFPLFSSRTWSFHCLVAFSAAFLLKKDALIRPSFRCRVFSFAAFFTKVSAISWPEVPLCPGTHRIIRAQILDASSTDSNSREGGEMSHIQLNHRPALDIRLLRCPPESESAPYHPAFDFYGVKGNRKCWEKEGRGEERDGHRGRFC